MTQKTQGIDNLPDWAETDIGGIKALVGKSRATVYRWIDKGILPAPIKRAGTKNAWKVGDVRRALAVSMEVAQ